MFLLQGPKVGQARGRVQWHADLGILKNNQLVNHQLLRTRSDAVDSNYHFPETMRMNAKDPPFRRRTRSGDSATMEKFCNTKVDPEEEGKGGGEGGMAGEGGVAAEGGIEDEEGVAGEGGVAGHVADNVLVQGKEERERGLIRDMARLNGDRGNFHRSALKAKDPLNLRRSRSSEELSTMSMLANGESAPNHNPDHMKGGPDHVTTREETDFCVLTYSEPEDLTTGGDYTFILDECEDYLSDEDMDDHSAEINDLTPLESPQVSCDGRESSLTMSTPINLPRASAILINAFQQRLENIMINIVDYPPGLFFVQ